MTPPATRFVIAVLTYRRPHDLERVLRELREQIVAVPDAVELLVIDNDPDGGAREMVQSVSPPVRYAHEPEPGIASARNRGLDEAGNDDVLIFIDDDETPSSEWLSLMILTWRSSGAQSVVGAVVSQFEVQPDAWVMAGRFFDRKRHPTGTQVETAATNNLLLDLAFVRTHGLRFDQRYGLSGGSDTLFTRQLAAAGGRIVWCDEATVVDRVPANRVTRDWVLKRSYRMGNSWSRTILDLAPTTTIPRARLIIGGTARVVTGAARSSAGFLTGSLIHRARGRRMLARGAGMLAGAVGKTYSEYARTPGRTSA